MEKLNKLDKVLIALASFLFVFVVSTVVIYTINGWQYDTLITCVLGTGGIEAIAGAFIPSGFRRIRWEDKCSSCKPPINWPCTAWFFASVAGSHFVSHLRAGSLSIPFP